MDFETKTICETVFWYKKNVIGKLIGALYSDLEIYLDSLQAMIDYK